MSPKQQPMPGLYPAIVTDIVDPENLGRVEVAFPWLGENEVRAWATLVTPYAEDDQGLFVLPEVETEVVVGFEAGEFRRPYVVGACWNGQESPPQAADAANDIRVLKTRSGSVLEFDDTSGSEQITLKTESGHELKLSNSDQEVVLTHSGGCVITISASKVDIQANASVDVNAPIMNVKSAVANFDGIINCQTLIAKTSVVSPTYTPGAGNVW